jgi:hypothetical protein
VIDIDDVHDDGCTIIDVGYDGVGVRSWVGHHVLNYGLDRGFSVGQCAAFISGFKHG